MAANVDELELIRKKKKKVISCDDTKERIIRAILIILVDATIISLIG